ncbi:hypothetical protein ACWGCW_21935 [Streptomyces sp. NPDC054933]
MNSAAARARAEVEAVAADIPTPQLGEPPAAVVLPAPQPGAVVPPQPEDEAPLVFEELTREQVIDWRSRAQRDHQVVDHIDRYGELSARRLFTGVFVDQMVYRAPRWASG